MGDWSERVWADSRARRSARLVLLTLAHYADTGAAGPTLRQLEAATGLRRPAVLAALRALVTLGELRVASGRGTRRPNRYTILLGGAP